jgi:sugar phosphate isomerase/epimerase
MEVLCSTGSLSRLPIREVFLVAKEAGFDGCELVVGKNFNRDGYKDEVLECLNILPIHSLHAPYVHIAKWGDEKQALARCIELAREIGAKVVTFHPPSWWTREFKFYKWFKKMQNFQELVQKFDRLFCELIPCRCFLPAQAPQQTFVWLLNMYRPAF